MATTTNRKAGVDLQFKKTAEGYYDLNVDETGTSLVLTDSLETSLLLSLFTDALADVSEEFHPFRRRGWWGSLVDWFSINVGSKLWLYEQSRITRKMLDNLGETLRQALLWLVDDGVAKTVSVSVTRDPRDVYGVVANVLLDGVAYKIPINLKEL